MDLQKISSASAALGMASTACLLASMLLSAPSLHAAQSSQLLIQANADLQAGEVDKVLAELKDLTAPGSAPAGDVALAHNLVCRARFAEALFDVAAGECGQAVRLEPENSDFHLWLGRALGERADKASFVNAYGLAKQTRAEFEEAVRLNPLNVPALDDLGDFYRQAPGIIGGGIDKAQQIALQMEKLDPPRALRLRGHIAHSQKDFATEERDLKMAISIDPHPAVSWTSLASFYARRKELDQMQAAINTAAAFAAKDRHAAVTLYDCAGLLIENKRDVDLAASLLESYIASPGKTEEAPAFIAHLRLARLKARAGDAAGAQREQQAALAMAHDYKPAASLPSQNERAGL